MAAAAAAAVATTSVSCYIRRTSYVDDEVPCLAHATEQTVGSSRRRIFTVNFTSWSTFVVQVVFLVGSPFVELSLFVSAVALLILTIFSDQISAFLTSIVLQ